MEKVIDKPVLPTLRELKVGESVSYPLNRTSYVRSVCVSYGLEWGKKFSTRINREDSAIVVTRVE